MNVLASTWPAYTARNVGQAASRPSSTLPARVSSQGGAVTGASGPWAAHQLGIVLVTAVPLAAPSIMGAG